MNWIFDDKIRTDMSFAQHLDDTYDFYDRTALPEFASIRETINL